MNSREPVINSVDFNLIARLEQIQAETESLAARQQQLLNDLRATGIASTRYVSESDDASDLRNEVSRLGPTPVHDRVDEASEESFPCSDAPAW